MIRILLIVLAGVVSAPLQEVVGIIWMRIIPSDLDLTANYFSSVVFPAALILHFAMALILWKLLEPQPKRNGSIYVGTHVLTQATLLTLLGNPPADIAMTCTAVLVSGALVMTVFNRYFWCPKCAGPI